MAFRLEPKRSVGKNFVRHGWRLIPSLPHRTRTLRHPPRPPHPIPLRRNRETHARAREPAAHRAGRDSAPLRNCLHTIRIGEGGALASRGRAECGGCDGNKGGGCGTAEIERGAAELEGWDGRIGQLEDGDGSDGGEVGEGEGGGEGCWRGLAVGGGRKEPEMQDHLFQEFLEAEIGILCAGNAQAGVGGGMSMRRCWHVSSNPGIQADESKDYRLGENWKRRK